MVVVFVKVGEIDTVREKFFAEVFVQASWLEPALDNMICSRMDVSRYITIAISTSAFYGRLATPL